MIVLVAQAIYGADRNRASGVQSGLELEVCHVDATHINAHKGNSSSLCSNIHVIKQRACVVVYSPFNSATVVCRVSEFANNHAASSASMHRLFQPETEQTKRKQFL